MNADKIEELAWNYFKENDLLKERDVQIQEVGAVAEQYIDELMLAIFVDAFEMGRKSK